MAEKFSDPSDDMYVRGIWDKNRTLKEIGYYKTSHQICLISQELIVSFLDKDSHNIFVNGCKTVKRTHTQRLSSIFIAKE
jgi:uncharacterized membrane protein YiaA